jgi:hypothetical protein
MTDGTRVSAGEEGESAREQAAVLGRVQAGASADECGREWAARLGRTRGREGNRPEFVFVFLFENYV